MDYPLEMTKKNIFLFKFFFLPHTNVKSIPNPNTHPKNSSNKCFKHIKKTYFPVCQISKKKIIFLWNSNFPMKICSSGGYF